MTVTDRAVYTLSQFGVTYSEEEYLGLRLADGMYEEGNKPYLMGFGEAKKIKSNIAQLVHQADMIATRFEMERYMFGEDANIPYAKILGVEVEQSVEENVEEVVETKKKKPNVDKDYKNQLFEDLFGDKK